MTEELPECVGNLTWLLTEDSFLELGEKNEGGILLFAIIRDRYLMMKNQTMRRCIYSGL